MDNNVADLSDKMAEATCIASLIHHPQYLLSDNILKPIYFYYADNQCFFWAIEELVTSGVDNIDALNLGNVLHSNVGVWKIMEKYGLTDIKKYIEMCRNVARGTFEEYHLVAETVATYAFRRELLKLSDDIGRECFNMKIDLDTLNDYVNNGIDKIAERFIFGSDSVLFGEKIDEVWGKIVDNRNDDGTYGLPSKIKTLNDYISFGKGELILVAGATGRGKSAYFLNEAVYNLQRGVAVAIIDSELTDEVYLPRILANISGVEVKRIKSGKYTKEEEKRIMDAIEWLKKQPFVHQFDPTFNKMKTEQLCRKWKNQKNMELLIYDYIKPTERYGAADISQSLGVMTDFLKGIAGSLNITAIAGLQLNKQTGQVADSQKPERYADVLLYWKEKTAEELRTDTLACGNYKMEILKNRNGAITGEDEYIDIAFQGDLMRISEAEKHVREALPFTGGKQKEE